MQLTNDQISELIQEIVGKEAVLLVLEIKNKENISEFKIAEKLKKTVNETRNYLYRLHEYEIVHFIRKKDKKKGWYVYYWTFDHKKAKNLLIELKRRKIKDLRDLMNKERSIVHFICPKGCLRVSLENALEMNYTCTECGSLMSQEDVTKKLKDIEEKVSKLEHDLGILTAPVVEKPKKKAKKAFKRLMKKKAMKIKKKIVKFKKKFRTKKKR